MHQSKRCCCPLQHCCNLCTIKHISGIMSAAGFLLYSEVTEPCTSGPVTSPVTPPSSWVMPSPSWHCTVFTTVPLLLLVLISAQWVTYLLPCCLPLPTERSQAPKCLYFAWFVPCCIPSFMSCTRSTKQGSVRICRVNLLLEPVSDQLPQTENTALLEVCLPQQQGC